MLSKLSDYHMYHITCTWGHTREWQRLYRSLVRVLNPTENTLESKKVQVHQTNLYYNDKYMFFPYYSWKG